MTMPNTGQGHTCPTCNTWVPYGSAHGHARETGLNDVPRAGMTTEQAERLIKQLTRIADAMERTNALATGAPRW